MKEIMFVVNDFIPDETSKLIVLLLTSCFKIIFVRNVEKIRWIFRLRSVIANRVSLFGY